jgi:proteasome accessory factor C
MLLAILGNLKRYDVVAVEELAAQLGCDTDELRRDLDTLLYAGIPPFGGGDLLPLEWDDDGYLCVVGEMPALDAPIRLTADETCALVLALAVAGYQMSDALPAKLQSATAGAGFDAERLARSLYVVRAEHSPQHLARLAVALDANSALQMEYVNNRGECSRRVVRPLALFVEANRWYLSADDDRSGEVRSFLVRNIRSIQEAAPAASDAPAAPAAPAPAVAAVPVSLDLQALPHTARIRFQPAASFAPAEWPGARIVVRHADAVEVDVGYEHPKWIARKVMALHGAAVVRFPDEVRACVVELARARLAEL